MCAETGFWFNALSADLQLNAHGRCELNGESSRSILLALLTSLSHIDCRSPLPVFIDSVAMQTILGPFYPDLETALVDQLLACKAADLLCPLLVLIPSDSLRRRLKLLLVGERRLSLLNVQLLTFHQLALRLREE